MSRRMVYVSILSAALALPAVVLAQTDGNSSSKNNNNQNDSSTDNNRGRGNRGGGRFDPAQMRQRFEGYMKDQLKVSDDEWKVIQPKLEKVFNLQRDSRGGGFFGRRGGDNNSSQDESSVSPVQKASRDLRQALDNKDASADEIAGKLKALREARDKSKTELASAQKDLKDVLTQRQEAVLVMMGLLD